MHMKGVASKFQALGLEYLLFFQDTNPLAFRALASCLGVSIKNEFVMNSLAVPRKAGEAAGAIVNLVKKSGTAAANGTNGHDAAPGDELPDEMVINVEYNLLGGLLKESGGDAPINDQNDSAHPGNCNILLFHVPTYVETLERSKGRRAGEKK